MGQQGVTTAENALANPYAPTGGAAGELQTSIGPAATPRTAYDMSGLARMPVDAGTTGQEAIMRRLEPTLARRDASLRQNLANQGLVAGGEAYRNAMTDEGQARNDLLSQAALQGINLDTAARAQGFGEQQAGANLFNTATAQGLNQQQQQAQFGNAAQMQELQRQLALRGQPLNEIGALMSGSQLQLPQFQNIRASRLRRLQCSMPHRRKPRMPCRTTVFSRAVLMRRRRVLDSFLEPLVVCMPARAFLASNSE